MMKLCNTKKERKSKSSWLLLPMLGNNYEYFDFYGNFINCYYSYDKKEELQNHLFLLYKYPEMDNLDPDDLEKMTEIDNKLRKNYNDNIFVDLLDIDNKHILAIYEINEKYIPEFELFKQSKYSHFSPKYKEEIIKFHKETSSAGLTKVLARDKDMLANIHRQNGCSKTKECNCKITNYLQCKHFKDFEWDMSTAECWSKVNEEEWLTEDKYKN